MGCIAIKPGLAPYCEECGRWIQRTIMVHKDGKITHYCREHRTEAQLKEIPVMFMCGSGIESN